MTTINTIEDLARILRDHPTWAEALRALLLTQELLDMPGRFDRFVETQREFNQAQQETNRLTDQRLNATEGRMDRVEGQLGNLQGGQYERTVRTKVLARSRFTLGFTGSCCQNSRSLILTSAPNSTTFQLPLPVSWEYRMVADILFTSITLLARMRLSRGRYTFQPWT